VSPRCSRSRNRSAVPGAITKPSPSARPPPTRTRCS
jgi:hypothetical protein